MSLSLDNKHHAKREFIDMIEPIKEGFIDWFAETRDGKRLHKFKEGVFKQKLINEGYELYWMIIGAGKINRKIFLKHLSFMKPMDKHSFFIDQTVAVRKAFLKEFNENERILEDAQKEMAA